MKLESACFCIKLERAGFFFGILAIPLSLIVLLKNAWLVFAINSGVWVHIAEDAQYESVVLFSAYVSSLLSMFAIPAAVFIIIILEKRHHVKLRYLYGIYYFFLVGTLYKICLLLPAIQETNTVANISIVVNASVAIVSAYVLFVLWYLGTILKTSPHSTYDCEIEVEDSAPKFTVGPPTQA